LSAGARPRDPTRVVTLADGRRLAYLELGDSAGPPVFYFHGLPGSRLEALFAHPAAAALGVRLIAVDRPGIGRSDPSPGRALLDWPADVAALADVLDLDRFSILGVSGGGPYAAACAWKLPERLRAVAIVAGVGPLDTAAALRAMSPVVRPFFILARRAPALLPIVGAPLAGLIRAWPAWALALIRTRSSPPDRAVLSAPEAATILGRGLAEAFRQGATGTIRELRLLVRPWGFEPAEIRVPVRLWHGEADRTVPAAMGHRLAATIPGCRARFLPDEGHFSLPVLRLREILEDLLAAGVSSGPNRLPRRPND
jgi:pimeloyl-ACP methyl ester carboxylesterase